MGLKKPSFRRKKSKSSNNLTSDQSSTLPPRSPRLLLGGGGNRNNTLSGSPSAASINDNSTIATQTLNSYSNKNKNVYNKNGVAPADPTGSHRALHQPHLGYANVYYEESEPPQTLPPLGLMTNFDGVPMSSMQCGAVDDSIEESDLHHPLGGHFDGNLNSIGNNLNAWASRNGGGGGMVGEEYELTGNGSVVDSVGTGSVFAGLTGVSGGSPEQAPTGNRNNTMAASYNATRSRSSDRYNVELRPAREPTPTNIKSETRSYSRRSVQQSVKQKQEQFDSPRTKQFDPPSTSQLLEPPEETLANQGQGKSTSRGMSLRMAMRREISRHRGGGVGARNNPSGGGGQSSGVRNTASVASGGRATARTGVATVVASGAAAATAGGVAGVAPSQLQQGSDRRGEEPIVASARASSTRSVKSQRQFDGMQKVGNLPARSASSGGGRSTGAGSSGRSRSKSRDAAESGGLRRSGGSSNRGFSVNSRDGSRAAAAGGGGQARSRSSSRGRTSNSNGSSGGGGADIQMTSASRGRSQSRSRKSSSSAAMASAAVAAGAAAAAASNSSPGGRFTPRSLSLRRNKKSFDSQDNQGFPDKATTPKSFDEEEYVDAGSFCSCGDTTLDEELAKGVTNKTTRGNNDPPTYNGDERSIDEESYYEDDYSITSFDEDGTYTSLDPPAKNGTSSTWASWFGFGDEEGGNDDTVLSPSDECSTQSGGSTVTKETMEDEKEKMASREVYNRQLSQKDAGSARSASSAKSSASQAATHDREGRPLPDGKPMKRVSSLKNTWKKLKSPSSPGGGGNSVSGSSYRSFKSNKVGDKSLASEGTHATASVSRDSTTRGSSSKSKSSSSNSVVTSKGGGSVTSNLSSGTKLLDKRSWDTDERQRDIYCHGNGGAENLRVRQYSDVLTTNAPDHVLVKIEASTVSSRDCVSRLHGEPDEKPNPSVPGFHIVGEVFALGSKVNSSTFRLGDRVGLGDRVAALLPNGGGNAKYISIPISSAIKLPEDARHEDIICLVANYMTAYQCLKLAKKDGLPLTNASVLITGGSGPVGQALVELALREGAKVYATAHKMHEEHLTRLGAKWFSVKPKKWLPYLEGKMDVVIDSLCVDGYESSYRALTPDGILVCNTGNTSAELHSDPQSFCAGFDDGGMGIWWSTVKAKYLWNRALFYDLNESYSANPKMFGHELHYLICMLQRGEIAPKVAGKVSLNQVPKAQKLIEKGLPNGTVVCLPWKKLDPKQRVKVEKTELHPPRKK